MLAALLHGKVSSRLEGVEDVLTSLVMGAFELLPPRDALLPFLRTAQPAGLLADLADLGEDPIATLQWWPWWDAYGDHTAAEPDVVIRLAASRDGQEIAGSARLVVVEAKWRSGKSGSDERDQLMRQAAQAPMYAGDGARVAAVLYVTAHLHWASALGDIQASQAAIQRHAAERAGSTPLLWTNWQSAYDVLSAFAATATGVQQRVAADACRVLERWGLARFNGVSSVVVAPAYVFDARQMRFGASVLPTWRFHE